MLVNPSAVFSPINANQLALSYSLETRIYVEIWDLDTGKCSRKFLQDWNQHSYGVHTTDNSVHCLAFSADATLLAASNGNREVIIWNTSNGLCVQQLDLCGMTARSISFSPCGQYIALSFDDPASPAWVWQVSSWGRWERFSMPVQPQTFSSVAFLPHQVSPTVLISASYGRGGATIWDLNNHCCVQALATNGHITSVAFLSGENQVALGSSNGTVEMWDLNTCKQTRVLKGNTLKVTSIACSPDKRHLASASSDNTVRIWDLRDCHDKLADKIVAGSVGKHAAIVKNPVDGIDELCITKRGTSIIRVDLGGASEVWSMDSGIVTWGASKVAHVVNNRKDFQSDPFKRRYLSLHFADILRRGPGFNFSERGHWMIYNRRNMVWVPAEYRPSAADATDTWLAVGTATGTLWICKIERRERRFLDAF